MLRFTDRDATRVLTAGDPDPVVRVNSEGASTIFLTCEHAGRAVPTALGDLGVAPEEMERHIAYDVGAEGVARGLAERLDAALILQRYSRLVIDCNRPFEAKDCIVLQSDGTPVPANADISDSERRARYVEIHQPLHEAIATALDRRQAAGKPSLLVSVHSFTPVMRATGAVRDFEIGLLYNRDARLAERLVETFRAANPDVTVKLNAPYHLGLHDPGAWRAARHSACAHRSAQRPHQRRPRAAGMGRAPCQAAAPCGGKPRRNP